jgi:flagellar hook-associated protein 2
MAGIQLTGLASGFDWKSTVTQLMAIERVPQDNLRRQQAAATKLQSAFDALKANLNAVKTAASALSTSFSGSPRSVSVASGDGVTSASDATVSTSSGAALGTYKIDVKSLPKASFGVGYDTIFPSVDKAKNLTLADYGVTEGQVTVNGTRYTIAASDLDDRVEDFFASHSLAAGLTTTFQSGGAFGHGALKLQGSPISIGGPGDTSNFVSALGFRYVSASSAYVQTIPQGVLAKVALEDLGGGMSVASDTLTINGVSVGTISKTATLGSVVSQINSTSGTGVTATIDPSTGRIRLTANANGDYPITVSDGQSGAGVAKALGLDTLDADPTKRFSATRGSGTTFTLAVNGEAASPEYTSTTAEIDLSQYGYGSTKITPSATGIFSVKVAASGADNRAKINSLITAYNSLKQIVDESTKVTTGADGKVSASIFSNRADINSLLSGIRSRVYTAVEGTGVSTQYNTMGKIGIGFDRNGTMSVVDSAKLDAALTNFPSAVDALLNSGSSPVSLNVIDQPQSNQFRVSNSGLKVGQEVSASWLPSGTKITNVSDVDAQGYYNLTVSKDITGGAVAGYTATYSPALVNQGVATRLVKLMTSLTGTGGLVASATTAITSQTKRLQRQIDAMDRSLAQQQAALENSFIAMERAQSKYNSMSSQIASAFTSNK